LHRWLGVAAAAALIPAAWLADGRPRGAHLAALAFAGVLMTAAGHYGGVMVHGRDYLVRHAPAPFRPAAASTGAVYGVYAQIVRPALAERCVECHGPDKQEAKLRLDTEDGLRGVIQPGDALASELVRRITLPPEHEKSMPARGDTDVHRLEPAAVAAIMDWINRGAVFAETPPPPLPPPAAPEVLAAAGRTGALVMPLAEGDPRLRVDASRLRGVGMATNLPVIGALGVNLRELDLANTVVEDTDLPSLSPLTGLDHLSLADTGVGDAGVASLTGLVALTRLNLNGTKVTDAGLEPLGVLTNLKRVHVWRTAVTTNGAAALHGRLPGVRVVLGDAPPAPKGTISPALRARDGRE
jgi:hypothetical protein